MMSGKKGLMLLSTRNEKRETLGKLDEQIAPTKTIPHEPEDVGDRDVFGSFNFVMVMIGFVLVFLGCGMLLLRLFLPT
jgi:hypothetical protein